MVLLEAGKLAHRRFVNIWNLEELRRIEVTPEHITVGSLVTYTQVRGHETLSREFSLLARAAAETGGIATQNRGTLGGNIANASPAADSPPALLAYDAQIELLSTSGSRWLPYRSFHTGYKKTLLAPDELIQAVRLSRRFSNYFSHARKVGARNAQAISKVCIAALGRLGNETNKGAIEDVRIALGSIAPVPLRLRETEQAVKGKSINPALLVLARQTAIGEIRPIDDIRSTAKYRAAVAGNLVVEFLNRLNSEQTGERTEPNILTRWNLLSPDAAISQILPCCGSKAWAHAISARRPIADEDTLLRASSEIWRSLPPSDWLEAFHSHPRIGESRASKPASAQSLAWSAQEQRDVTNADAAAKAALADANREYEHRFNRIFIVCAIGKSALEILAILQRRLNNDAETELHESAEQQRQITELRLKKWLQP